MSTFAQILDSQSKIPERHVVLNTDAYCSEWTNKQEVALGLRKIADGDIQTARAEAAKYALMMHDDREGQIDCFNDALMRWLIVRGTCDSNDVTLNAPLFEGFEENVKLSLTSNSIRYVWDAIERYHLETSPIFSEATDHDCVVLADLLVNLGAMRGLGPIAQKRVRKLLGFCLSELKDALVDLPEEEDSDMEVGVEVEDEVEDGG